MFMRPEQCRYRSSGVIDAHASKIDGVRVAIFRKLQDDSGHIEDTLGIFTDHVSHPLSLGMEHGSRREGEAK